MAFWARSFIFDGTPSENFGLMLYDIEGHKQDDGVLGSKIKIKEDRLSRRPSPIHYGTIQNEPLEFKITFGVADADSGLDRFDMSAVAYWLTGHSQYKWLNICQPDMLHVRYKCLITELKQVTVGWLTVAFEATVTCDGPFAYHVPITEFVECADSVTHLLRNPCNIPTAKTFPIIKISCLKGTNNILIRNLSANNMPFELTGLSKYTPCTITIDSANQIITTDKDISIYTLSNLHFPFFVPGDNTISVTGAVKLEINYSPLINIGY